MSIVDQYHDAAYGVLYQRLQSFPELYEVVKTAEIEPGGDAALPDSAFAWRDQRRFPIHTREHTAISYAYAKEAAEVPVDVKDRLRNALDVYGVPEHLFEGVKVAAAPVEVRYALPDQKLIPLVDREKAAAAFQQNAYRLPVALRTQAAVALASEGARNAAILKYAGLTVCNTKEAADWVEARADAVKEGEYKDAYLQLADGLRKQPAYVTDRHGLVKMAAAIDELDHKSNIWGHYRRRLPDAMETLFNTDKVASETVDLGGVPVSVDELSKISSSTWNDLAGPEFVREITSGGAIDPTKLAAVVETLPLDLKQQLRRQMGC